MINIKNIKYDNKIQAYIAELPSGLVKSGTLMQLPANYTLALRTTSVDYAYIALSGELSVLSETKEGKSYSWLILSPFTVISDLEILSGNLIYAATVVTTQETVVLRVTVNDFITYLTTNLQFAQKIIHNFASNTYRNTYNRGNHIYKTGFDKVALYLLMYCSDNPPTPAIPTVVQKTQQTIAIELAVSIKTITRSIKRLKCEGYISTTKGKILISSDQYHQFCVKWG